MRQSCDIAYQQITAAKLGLDQMFGIIAANQCKLLAKPIDDDIDGAVAYCVLRTIKQFPDFAAGAEAPGLGYEVGEQPPLRTRQIRARAVLTSEQIAAGVKSHPSETEILGSGGGRSLSPAPHANDLLDRFVEPDEVDWSRDTARRAGDPILVQQ